MIIELQSYPGYDLLIDEEIIRECIRGLKEDADSLLHEDFPEPLRQFRSSMKISVLQACFTRSRFRDPFLGIDWSIEYQVIENANVSTKTYDSVK